MASHIFVLERDLAKSKNFRTLPATAIVLLLDFLMKRQVAFRNHPKKGKQMNILNNGEIEYCYSEAEKRGIPRQTFARNLDVLVERGFIDIAHSGAGGKKGDKSLYAISERWRKWGRDDFVVVAREKDQRKGHGFAAMWQKRKKLGNADGTSVSNEDVTRKTG